MTLQKHLRILAGGTEKVDPAVALRVAFATTDRKHVDQHFGSAQGFAIYTVNLEQTTLAEFAQFGDLEQDGHEDKLSAKLALIRDCVAVYCQAVGGSAIRQLLADGIQPVRVEEGTPIEHLLQDLQKEWRTAPSGWLARAIARHEKPTDRFALMEAEGWQE